MRERAGAGQSDAITGIGLEILRTECSKNGETKLMWLSKLSEREYRANIEGMNIFFGATLGMVMAGAEKMRPYEFGLVIALIACIVVTILYISSSNHRKTYAALALTGALLLSNFPLVTKSGVSVFVPPYVQPTLIVWILMTILVEFSPRRKAEDA
jgi:hypothetical protein